MIRLVSAFYSRIRPVYGLLVLILFYSYLYMDIIRRKALLVDDLYANGERLYHPRWQGLNFTEFINMFMNLPFISSRPVSGFIYGCFVYAAGYSLNIYYLLYVFFLLSLWVIYRTAQHLANDETAFVITTLYGVISIGTSITFCPIMCGSNLATIFYCLSIYYLVKDRNPYISAMFFLLSVFSYEIYAPLLLVSMLLVKGKNGYRLLYVFGIIAAISLYRYGVEPLLFPGYYHREQPGQVLDMARNLAVLKGMYQLLPDYFEGIARAVNAIRFFSFSDYLVCAVFVLLSALYLYRTDARNLQGHKKVLLLSVAGIAAYISIFLFSDYLPSMNGFENRVIGALRLSVSVLLFSFVWLLRRYLILKPLLFVLIAVLTVTTVATKNGWVYASNHNVAVIGNLRDKLPETPDLRYVLITYDMAGSFDWKDVTERWGRDAAFIVTDPHFIFREPVFFTFNEIRYLQMRAGIDAGYRIYYYFHRQQDGLENLPPRYYLYDAASDNLMVAENHAIQTDSQ